jgi:flagella basal body P-ring formation protein FlgA
MLCRHFKLLSSIDQEFPNCSCGEGMAFVLKDYGLQKSIGKRPLNSDRFDCFDCFDCFDWLRHSLSTLKFSKLPFLFLLLCLGTYVQADNLTSVQVASLGKETEPQKISPPTVSSALQLQFEAKNWLAQQLKVSAEQIQIDEMDARLKVQPCSVGVSFDHPFANRQVIRARCEKPSWQFFLKANLSDEQAIKLTNKLPSSSGVAIAQGNAINANLANGPKTVVAQNTSSAAQNIVGTKLKAVLVANQPLRRGTILQPSLFKLVEMNVPSTDNMVLSQFKEIENTELLHDMGTEQAIRSYDIKPTLLVKRGQQVNFSIGEGRGFLITIKTEAQQDGSLGDQIKLKNVESGRLISGVITGLNEARAL